MLNRLLIPSVFNKQTNLLPTQVSHTPDQTLTPPFGKLQSMQPGKLVIRPVYPSQHSYATVTV
ncbi:hypothetical protein BDR07DRAFT_1438662, partial [Suillus spraguei]